MSRGGRFIGGLDRVDANGTIKEGSGEKVWIMGTPINL
jgi:hypothetical protein